MRPASSAHRSQHAAALVYMHVMPGRAAGRDGCARTYACMHGTIAICVHAPVCADRPELGWDVGGLQDDPDAGGRVYRLAGERDAAVAVLAHVDKHAAAVADVVRPRVVCR